MKKIVPLSALDILFLLKAVVFNGLPDQKISMYKRVHGLYQPQEFSEQNPEHARMMQQVVEAWKTDSSADALAGSTAPVLLNELAKDHVFLPLDRGALDFIHLKGLKYRLPTDLIDSTSFYKAIEKNYRNYHAWLEKTNVKLFGWSENWLLYAGDPLFQLMQQACIAEALTPFMDDAAEEIICIQRSKPGVLPPFGPSDLCPALWAAALPEKVRTFSYASDWAPASYDLENPEKQDFSVLENAIVLGIFESHLQRHENTIKSIIESSRRPVALLLTQDRQADDLARALSKGETDFICPAVAAPAFDDNPRNFPEKVIDAFQESAQGLFPHAKSLRFVFAEYAAREFYNQELTLKFIRDQFKRHRPALCIAENMMFGKFSIPLLAARRLGIPGISLPHGEPIYPAFPKIVPAACHVVCSPHTRDALKPFLAPEEEIIELGEMEMNYTHGFEIGADLPLPKDKKIVLVALGSIHGKSPLAYTVYPGHVAAWLRTIYSIPEDLSDKIHILFKQHPGYADSGLLRGIGIEEEQILPLEASLKDYLPHTSLMVACEYISSPGLIAMANGIPALHCLHDDVPQSFNSHQNKYRMAIARAGEVAKSPELFWEKARPLLLDERSRQLVIERQKAFYQERIVPRHHGWPGVIARVIAGKSVYPA